MMPSEPTANQGRASLDPAPGRARRMSQARPHAPVVVELVADDDRETFLEILSHELRTPVTTIYGGARVLAAHELSPDRRRALAEDVSAEAERLYRVVEDLVILVRSERDGIRPVGEPVNVGRLVLDAVERELTRHPDIRIRVSGLLDAAADDADEVMVTHVIRNLLDNAIRYGGDGPIEIVLETTSAEVAVRVVDRGAAPAQDADPFKLSSGTPSTAAGRAGAGIGLYVAERLVAAMRGRMWAARSAAHGAEFGFALNRSVG